MNPDRLSQLAAKAESGEVAGLELLRALTADGSFIKRMEAVGKGGGSAEGRLDCLHLLAIAADFHSPDVRSTIEMLLDEAIESGLLRMDALLCPRNTIQTEALAALLSLVREVMVRMPAKAQALAPTVHILRSARPQPTDKELVVLHDQFLVKARELDESAAAAKERKALARKSPQPMSIEACQSRSPPEDFRQLPVIPGADDMLGPPMPYLRPIREVGAYLDAAEYLDVHFRLLREDCLHDLRHGVRKYESNHRAGQKNSPLRFYRGAQIGIAKVDNEGMMVSTVSFDTGPLKKTDWEASKRLKCGSLLLFSSDDFKADLVFGLVERREAEELRKGLLGVVFEKPSLLLHHRRYVFAETPAYFGAYRYVMEGLQWMEPAAIPFAAQIVDAVTQVDVPAYLAGASLDFAPLMGEAAKRGRPTGHFRRLVQQKAQWPRPADFGPHGLDPSQLEALRHALTRKLAIVQGPPGTGKTFLGLLLLRLLLHPANRKLWWQAQGLRGGLGAPILIVCYTNHALDQFLEGILDFPDDQAGKVIRVGGGSKVERLKAHSLYEARHQARDLIPVDLKTRDRTSRDELMRRQGELFRCRVGLKLIESEVLDSVSLERLLGRKALAAVKEKHPEWVRLDAFLCWTFLYSGSFFDWLIGAGDLAQDFSKAFQAKQGGMEAGRGLTERKLSAVMGQNTGYAQAALSLKQSDFDVKEACGWLTGPLAQPGDPSRPRRNVVGGRNVASEDFAKGLRDMEKEWMRHHFVSVDDYSAMERALVGDRAYQPAGKKGRQVLGRQWAGLKAQLLGAPPMSLAQMAQVADLSKDQPFCLPLAQRWAFMTGLRDALAEMLRGALTEAETAYARTALLHKEVRLLVNTEVLRTASVIGMTTTGAAKWQTALQAIRPPIVVVEEAAEVLEAHLLTSLSRHTQHLVMIGDHQQLRPSVAVHDLARKYHLDVSLFERLVNNGMPHVQLTQQHRMRPAISRPLMPVFYPDLRDHPNTHGRPHIQVPLPVREGDSSHPRQFAPALYLRTRT